MPDGEPKNPKETLSISVTSRTIEVVEEVCEMWGMSRSFLFERAVKTYIGSKIAKDPYGWKRLYKHLIDES